MTVTPTPYFPAVEEFIPDEKEHRRKLARAIRSLIQGKMNVVLAVTLNASAVTTTITDARINFYSAIIPAMATTASAATAIAAGIYITNLVAGNNTSQGSATIHHASNAAIDQTIVFVILG